MTDLTFKTSTGRELGPYGDANVKHSGYKGDFTVDLPENWLTALKMGNKYPIGFAGAKQVMLLFLNRLRSMITEYLVQSKKSDPSATFC